MKQFLNLPKNLIQYPTRRTVASGITVGATAFTFPNNALVDHTKSVILEQETSFDDVTIEFIMNTTFGFTAPRLGLFMKSASDLNAGEQAGFIADIDGIHFYRGDAWQETLGEFDPYAMDGQPTRVSLQRLDDYYIFTVGDIQVAKRVQGDGGLYYRQNAKCWIYGNDMQLEVQSSRHFTYVDSMDVAILGDSIFQGYLSGGGDADDTIKGILSQEYGMDIHEYAGSANIIKDQLDAFNELAILKPRFGLVGYGHNDEYFSTGRTVKDYNLLIAMMLQYNIQPVVCTMPYSPWVNVETTLNPFIRKTLFPRFPHVELYPVLTYQADYRASDPHPNVGGNRKLAMAIKPVLDGLLTA